MQHPNGYNNTATLCLGCYINHAGVQACSTSGHLSTLSGVIANFYIDSAMTLDLCEHHAYNNKGEHYTVVIESDVS